MLYQLSYSHHANAPTNDSQIHASPVDWDPRSVLNEIMAGAGRRQSCAAIPLAASTSGPGGGTKTVRR